MKIVVNLRRKCAPIGLVISSFILVLGSLCSGARDAAAYGQSVLTQHNDNQRTGANLHETQLTPGNVTQSLGLVYTLDVSSPGWIAPTQPGRPAATKRVKIPNTIGAQPLYVARLMINGTAHEVLYVSTRQNWIFAYDVTGNAQPQLLWKKELRDNRGFGAEELPGMEARFPGDNRPLCGQTRGPVGIASTPVIDEASNTMWVIYRTSSPLQRVAGRPTLLVGPSRYDAKFYLRKLDIRTGAMSGEEAIDLPTTDKHWADRNLTRTGLLLLNGVIYVGFAGAVCDDGGGPDDGNHYHGWIVALDADKLTVKKAVPTTSAGFAGGIWQSGSGLAANRSGYIFALTGNHEGSGGPELGDSFLRIHATSLEVTSYYPPNWHRFDNPSDSDMASGGAAVLPNGLAVGGGKPGFFYLMNPSSMNHPNQAFQAFYNSWHPEIPPCEYDTYQGYGPNIHGAPVVWHPDSVAYSLVYHMPEKDYLKGFRAFDDGRMDEKPYLTTQESGIRSPRGMPGGALSLSASSGHNGILWVSVIRQEEGDGLETNGEFHGRLIAFDALTLNKIWEATEQNVSFAKYIPPTIGGGKVFRSAYADQILVYGLKSGQTGVRPTTRMGRMVSSPARYAALGSSPTRPVTAKWLGDHLHLFMASRQMSGGSVLSTNWEPGNCATGIARAWRGWYPVESNFIPNYGDGGKLPLDYGFAASGAAPVTVLWQDAQHLELFVADNSGRVMTISFAPVRFPLAQTPPVKMPSTGWGTWIALPGISVAPRQPITALWRNPNHLDLFTIDRNGRVMSIFFENGKWQPSWFAINPNSGVAAPGQQVAAVWRNPNHLDLFITSKDGKVMSTFFDNNKWQAAWFPINPQSAVTAPGQDVTAVWRPASNHLDLFITAADGRILSTYFDNNKWQPAWFAINPGSGIAAPGQLVTALWRNPNHLDMFITDKQGRVLSTYFDNNHWQTAWFPISPNTAITAPGQPVTAVWAHGNNHLDLFITGIDGRVMSIFFDNNQWAPGWFAI